MEKEKSFYTLIIFCEAATVADCNFRMLSGQAGLNFALRLEREREFPWQLS